MHDQSRAVGGRGEFLPELIRTLSCKDGEEADVIGGFAVGRRGAGSLRARRRAPFRGGRPLGRCGTERGVETAGGSASGKAAGVRALGPDVRGHGRGTFPSRVSELRRSVAGPPGRAEPRRTTR